MKKQQILLFFALIIIIVAFVLLNMVHCFSEACPWEREKPEPDLPKVILTFVGPWDSASDWSGIAKRFNQYKKSSGIDVIIQYQTLSDQANYEDIIREMQFEGNGPNIYTIFNNWVPRYTGKLLPMPANMITLRQYQDTFAPVAYDDLVIGGKVYALPFYIDTPILFYNTDRFLNEAYRRPPETWAEFRNYAEKLTVFEKKIESENILNDGKTEKLDEKKIEIAGAAIGGGSNVNRSQDILMLLVMQNNIKDNVDNLVSFNNRGTLTAIKTYTDFTDPEKRFYTWNEDQMYSIDAFTQRKAAMMINYTHHINTVNSKTGGALKFKVAPVPQLDMDYKVNYASYWVPVVPKTAPCRAAVKVDCYALSWEFLNFAAQKENARLYLDSTNQAAANLELAAEQANTVNDMRSFSASQVPTAKSWSRSNEGQADKALVEMIDSIISKDEKVEISNAMNIVKNEIIQLN